jgi:predicted transcriptional regulator
MKGATYSKKRTTSRETGSQEDTDLHRIKHYFDLLNDELEEKLDESNAKITFFKGLNKRRSEMEILALILKVAREGVIKSKIVYRVNISLTQTNKFLSYLINEGFLREKPISKRSKLFCTTDKGDLYLLYWAKMTSLFEKQPISKHLSH